MVLCVIYQDGTKCYIINILNANNYVKGRVPSWKRYKAWAKNFILSGTKFSQQT